MSEERFPRVTIRFCTQCRWMLRAAYYAQELLSTFSTTLGQVSLQPSTGGVFTVTVQAGPEPQPDGEGDGPLLLWDRQRDGGFPEVKELKRRLRDVVDPARDLGHVDRAAGGGGKDGGGDAEAKLDRREVACEDEDGQCAVDVNGS